MLTGFIGVPHVVQQLWQPKGSLVAQEQRCVSCIPDDLTAKMCKVYFSFNPRTNVCVVYF